MYLSKKFILSILLFIFIGCENTQTENMETVDVQFSYSNQSDTRAKSSVDKTPVAIILSIENAIGEKVHESKRLELQDFSGNIITQPLPLLTGNYNLTEYKIVNAENKVIYASPMDASTAAKLVNDALKIGFSVSKDETNIIRPEVLDTETFTPEEFGYPSLGFEIVPTFNFLIAVKYYDETLESYKLTDANVEVKSGNHTDFNETIGDTTASIRVRDLSDSTYTVTISKVGYDSKVYTFTHSEIKSFSDLPLSVILISNMPTPILKWLDGNAAHKTFPENGVSLTSDVSNPVFNIYNITPDDDNRHFFYVTNTDTELNTSTAPYLSYTFNVNNQLQLDKIVVHGNTTRNFIMELRSSVDNFSTSLGQFAPASTYYQFSSVDLSSMNLSPNTTVEFRVYIYKTSGNSLLSLTGGTYFESADGTSDNYNTIHASVSFWK